MSEPSKFDKMIGAAIRVELTRQGLEGLDKIDWGLVGYQAVEAYGFGPDTMPGGTWPTGAEPSGTWRTEPVIGPSTFSLGPHLLLTLTRREP